MINFWIKTHSSSSSTDPESSSGWRLVSPFGGWGNFFIQFNRPWIEFREMFFFTFDFSTSCWTWFSICRNEDVSCSKNISLYYFQFNSPWIAFRVTFTIFNLLLYKFSTPIAAVMKTYQVKDKIRFYFYLFFIKKWYICILFKIILNNKWLLQTLK